MEFLKLPQYYSTCVKEGLFHTTTNKEKKNETGKQVGGNHYESPIDPDTYIEANKLTFREGNIVKYVTRHRRKNGLEDLLKARHYLDMLIEKEGG